MSQKYCLELFKFCFDSETIKISNFYDNAHLLILSSRDMSSLEDKFFTSKLEIFLLLWRFFFSAGIQKRRVKKATGTSNIIRCKLGSFSNKFLLLKIFKVFFRKLPILSKIWKWHREWRHVNCVVITQCVRKSIYDLSLRTMSNSWYIDCWNHWKKKLYKR